MKKREIVAVILLGVLAGVIFYFPILASGNALGIQDWDQNLAWTEATRVSLLVYHQFPYWNPFKCGGSIQFGNPQIPVISLQTALALIFGTLQGIKLSILLHGIFGFVGFYFLARQYRLRRVGSLLAAILFSFSGITASYLAAGMVVFTPFAYVPYILLCFNRSMQAGWWKWALLAGALMAFTFYHCYQIPLLLAVYLVLYVLAAAILQRSWRPFVALAVTGGVALLLSLPRLALSLQMLLIFPRPEHEISGYNLAGLVHFLFSTDQNMFKMGFPGMYFEVGENCLYVGLPVFILFLVFFVNNRKGMREYAVLLAVLPFMLWLLFGNMLNPSLYTLLKHLPGYSSFEVAQRFRFDFIIPFALLAGLGLDNLVRLLQQFRLAKPLALVCTLAVFGYLTVFASVNFLNRTLIIRNPEAQLPVESSFIQVDTAKAGFPVERTIALPEKNLTSKALLPASYEYLRIRQNEGVIPCYDSVTQDVAALGREDENYRGEFYLLKPDPNTKVENTLWSPNVLEYTVHQEGSGSNNTLVVNQNDFPGWVVIGEDGTCRQAQRVDGLLATAITPSTQRITFRFAPFERWLFCKR